MATQAKNNIVRAVAPKSIFESAKAVLSATNDWNQGDLLAFDTTSKVLKAVTAVTDSANILGVAKQTVVDGKVKSPYVTDVDASAAIENLAGPVYGVVAELKLTTGDTFAPGAKVYLTATDAQTVTSVQPGAEPHIGIYQGKNIASAAAGAVGEILVGARYGADGILF